MRTRVAIRILLLIVLAFAPGAWAKAQDAQQANYRASEYGPEVTAYLDFLRGEEEELNFQIRRGEISRKAYSRAKSKVTILRQMVLKIYDETGQDLVPELHVVASDEVDQLIEDGNQMVKTLKPDDVIAEKWRYVGTVVRGEPFYIFERLTRM